MAFAGLATAPGWVSCFAPAGESGDRLVLVVAALVGTAALGWLVAVARGALPKPSLAVLLVAALALRLAAAAGPTRFDDDLWRYLWDGAATTAGVSPYEFAPQEVLEADPTYDPLLYEPDELHRLEHLRRRAASEPRLAGALERVNFPQFPTIYPPTSQLAFATSAWLAAGSDRLWRFLSASADWWAVWFLVRLLSAVGRPRWWAATYALHPLPALEFGAAGHQDAFGILLLVAAAGTVVAWRSAAARESGAGALLALAGGIKLFPLLLMWPWRRALRWRGLAVAAAVAALSALSFAGLGPVDLGGFAVYVQRWEFFSGPYALLAAPAEWLGLGPAAVRVWGRAVAALAFVALLTATGLWRSKGMTRRRIVARGLVWVEALIVLSPVVNPWYVPWALAAGAVRRSLAWPVFGLLVPLAYLGSGAAGHPGWLRAIAWLPLVVLLGVELRSLARSTST